MVRGIATEARIHSLARQTVFRVRFEMFEHSDAMM